MSPPPPLSSSFSRMDNRRRKNDDGQMSPHYDEHVDVRKYFVYLFLLFFHRRREDEDSFFPSLDAVTSSAHRQSQAFLLFPPLQLKRTLQTPAPIPVPYASDADLPPLFFFSFFREHLAATFSLFFFFSSHWRLEILIVNL